MATYVIPSLSRRSRGRHRYVVEVPHAPAAPGTPIAPEVPQAPNAAAGPEVSKARETLGSLESLNILDAPESRESPELPHLSHDDVPGDVVREEKVRLARQRLASGAYDEPAVLDAAISKMLRDLT